MFGDCRPHLTIPNVDIQLRKGGKRRSPQLQVDSGHSSGMMVGGKTGNMSNCNFSIPRNTNISLHNHRTDRHKVMFHDSAAVTSPGIMSNMLSQGQKNYILCGI